jgi:hypothetical protein
MAVKTQRSFIYYAVIQISNYNYITFISQLMHKYTNLDVKIYVV